MIKLFFWGAVAFSPLWVLWALERWINYEIRCVYCKKPDADYVRQAHGHVCKECMPKYHPF